MMTDFDSPWKEALDVYFQACLALLFPEIHARIDWSRGCEMLDKEFQKVVPEAEQGRRYVDKLVKVWAKDGAEMWILLHLEVQTTRDADFPRRMYVYNYRIDQRYNWEVVSIAILADDDPNWRPGYYEWEKWGCRKRLDFPHVKLLDYVGREEELEASDNPFARVLLAHLATLQTRDDHEGRRIRKTRLVRGLFERGLTKKDTRQLFRLIDWLMELPPALSGQFWDEVKQIQEVRKMPFITTPERIGMEKGMEKGERAGLLKAIQELLRARFGKAGLQAFRDLANISEEDKLMAALRAIGTAATLKDAKQSWL